jgi:hypothetical protein
MKIFATFLILFTVLNAQAEVFTLRGDGACSEPNISITAIDLKNLLDASESINGCQVFKTDYAESLGDGKIPPLEDGYQGPVLYVTVASTTADPMKTVFNVLLIRANKPLCLIKDNENQMSLNYRAEYSISNNLVDFLFTGKTLSQRLSMDFSSGKLSMVTEEIITTTGGSVLQNKQRSLFQCGTPNAETRTMVTP